MSQTGVRSHEETESERYMKQLIRINQMGIFICLIFLIEISGFEYYGIITLMIPISITIIGLNILAFLHSAYGVNPGYWAQEKLQDLL